MEERTVSDEQRLNSLNRFRKQSDRLVLEEHGHCEIPAGCGGIVLRWRNPRAAVPVSVFRYGRAPTTCWLDGTELQLGRIDLTIDRHVLAVAVEEVDLSAGLILFAAHHDPKDYQRGKEAKAINRPLKVLSVADGSWKYSLTPPPAEWTALSFEDHDWPALKLAPMPTLDHSDEGYYAYRRCADVGARCLGLPSGKHPKRGKVWIRKLFEVHAPEERPS
jgi:hypothetical protein